MKMHMHVLVLLMILVYVVLIAPFVIVGFSFAGTDYEVIGLLCLLMAFAARETARRLNTRLILWWVTRYYDRFTQ